MLGLAGTDQDAFAKRCAEARCRVCGEGPLEPVLDLGMMPLSDRLRTPAMLAEDEPRYPLEVAFSPVSKLVQILETVPPDVLFDDDYPYYSSFSDYLLKHSKANAEELITMRGLGSDSLAVELASNDGYLLKNFVAHGVPVLGIDPAKGPVEAARKIGVETMHAFFTADLAERLAANGTRADVIIGNNVLAHVADTNGFVRGIRTLLKDTGVAVIECPYLRDLIDHNEFDTIYHEHLCYFSVHALDYLFRRNGLFLNDVRRLPIHGGSLRLYVEPVENVGDAVKTMLDEERRLGMDEIAYYQSFAERVRAVVTGLRELVESLRNDGRTVAAYGAAAKGAIMLNAAGLGAGLIDFVVDRNVHKQGRYMPGVDVPILAPDELAARRPDYAIILPWNFRDEIVTQQTAYTDAGGRFIVPIPTPTVL